MDALVIVSQKDVKLPKNVVLLPPFPTVDLLPEEGDEYFRTTNVLPEDLPEGIVAVEISPESFLSLETPNPNKPEIPTEEEINKKMTKDEVLQKSWSVDLLTGKRGGEDESD
jgi:hypothetical protein